MRSIRIYALVLLFICAGVTVVKAQDAFPDLDTTGANWGIWIDNGLVNPGETVRMTVSVPLNTPVAKLPSLLEIHARYLEEPSNKAEIVTLKWKKTVNDKQWQAQASYRPGKAGNYYAAIKFYGHEISSYFSAWQPGLTAVNFWMQMPAEFHDENNLKDIYLPVVKQEHFPIDYEIVLVGERVFKDNWEPRKLFREAQVETGTEVIPFFDGGYFHKLDPEFTDPV